MPKKCPKGNGSIEEVVILLFGEKNDGGIELHLSLEERKLVYEALRHYCAYGKNEQVIVDEIPLICEMMNVLFIE